MIEKYKHIIWDWNGTIFNDVELSHSLINNLLTKYNIKTITLDEYKDYFTMPVRSYYESIGFDFTKLSFEVVGKEWMDEYERRKYEANLAPGIVDVLKKNKSLGIDQSILSAYSQHTLEEVVGYFNLKEYFSHIVGLDNIYAASKLQQGKDLIKKIGLDGGSVLLIGDMIHDLEVAREIGADCILLGSGHQSVKNLKELSLPLGDITILPSVDKLLNFD